MKRLSKLQVEDLCKMYETGNYSFKDLDLHFNLSLGSCRGLLLRRGYKSKTMSELNRKYTLDENFFDLIDTEEKAYFLGLLYADGCNFPEGTRVLISLHEKDIEILNKFNTIIKSNKPLYCRKRKGNEGNQWCLTISSKKISKDLEKLGVIKAKSLILKFPSEKQVPKEFQRHFIRGYFDGDGCITSCAISRNKEGRKSDVKWSIVGTEDFTLKTQQIMIKMLNLNKTKIQHVRNVFYLEYKGGKQIMKIKNWLYENATIFLERKYNKFLNYG